MNNETEETSRTIHKTSKLDIKYSKSNFNFHTFYADLNNEMVMFQVVKMSDSVYIWIGYRKQPKLFDLSLAMDNKYGSVPISTRLLGETTEETSKNMAIKICKRLKKVVYISLNIEDNKFNLPPIEKKIQEEITEFPDKF